MVTSTPQTSSRPRVPAPLLVLLSIASVQFGGALAVTLLPLVGVAGSVTLRLVVAGFVLLVALRPSVRGHARRAWAWVLAFGTALAVMNSAFYASLTRLPIGVAVTIEFVGPLLLSAILSRRALDLAAVVVAAAGIVLISGLTTSVGRLDLLGVGLALMAGAAWAAYILCSERVGAHFPGVDGLALAMVVAAVLVAPFGVTAAGASLLSADAVVRGTGIALLSSVIPYSLELLALRHMKPGVFGVLLSMEPAVAALAGLLVLGQVLHGMQLVGMACVVLASVTVTLGSRPASDTVAEEVSHTG